MWCMSTSGSGNGPSKRTAEPIDGAGSLEDNIVIWFPSRLVDGISVAKVSASEKRGELTSLRAEHFLHFPRLVTNPN
jgi:hypothetical protein